MSELWLCSHARSGLRLALVIAAVACAALATPASAQQPPAGNARQGKIIGYTCLGCHGIRGYRNAYPDYAVPRLRGQSVTYLITALNEYRDGHRAYPTMHLQAMSLSEQQIADVATYLGGKPLTGAQPVAASAVPQAAEVCASCHGADGIGVAPMYPTLAGQHESYLIRVLHEYQSGYRQSPIMDAIAHSLTNEQIRTVAAYFSHLKPGLHTVPRLHTRWSTKR
jgi:cytochrome c553